jgi:hypothetical protein
MLTENTVRSSTTYTVLTNIVDLKLALATPLPDPNVRFLLYKRHKMS